jgi:small subunit ribosomal protein S3
MGQKVHPIGFRLGISHKHPTQWFAPPRLYEKYIGDDTYIRQLCSKTLKKAGITTMNIERSGEMISVSVYLLYPRVLTGANDDTIQNLISHLRNRFNVHIQLRLLRTPRASAQSFAHAMVSQLEKRVAFRRVLRSLKTQALRANVDGIKVQISGRLNGAEIARSEWLREGRVPLHTLREPIDYCSYSAHTIYGVLGIKVWVLAKSF